MTVVNPITGQQSIDNSIDVSRKYPTTILAEKVLTAREGVVVEQVPGTNAAPFELAEPLYPGRPIFMLAFVTASGAPATKTLLLEGADYARVDSNANGKGELTPVADLSLQTLLILYSPHQPEATPGGQTIVTPAP